ncbi:MAG: hypothetical protein ABW167_06545 [Baekduia sp.]
MTLLLRDTANAPEETAAAAPVEAPPEVRTCPTCHAPLEDGQDWCLNCGEAQPSRRISLPGKRAAATVMALTTVLVGGAVAASYAALQDGTETPATTPTQVAQVPAPAPAPAPDPAAAAAAAAAAASSAVPAEPSTPGPIDTGVLPDDGGSSTYTPPPSSDDFSDSSSSQGTSSSTETATGNNSGTGDGDSTADTRTSTSTTPAETEPVAITLGEEAGALYDPYKRDTAAGDAKKAFDADPNTSFPITVAPGSTQVGAGLAVDLSKQQGIREIELTTKTPGFKVEIYATDDTELPPDVLDTRWAHVKDVTGVGSDADAKGKQIIKLGSGATKYRHVLLWFTAPPTDGSTVRIQELKLLG